MSGIPFVAFSQPWFSAEVAGKKGFTRQGLRDTIVTFVII